MRAVLDDAAHSFWLTREQRAVTGVGTSCRLVVPNEGYLQMDRFERLIRVAEEDSGTGLLSLVTTYTYDVLDKII